MKMENFEKLESKIINILETMEKLKQENHQISASYDGLTNKVFECEQKAKELLSQNNQLKSEVKTAGGRYNKEKEKVKKRIKTLIDKIEMLENMS
jgi:FtsZ-binding cell division protein ZapB